MKVNKLSRWRKLARLGIKVQGRNRALLVKKPPIGSKHRLDNRLQRSIKLLLSGKKVKGLRLLNRLAGATTEPIKLAKIQGALAQYAFKNGDFADAASQYATINQSVSTHPRQWFVGAIGQVRALLKNANVEEAMSLARQAVTKGEALHTSFINSAGNAASNFRVGVRPHRPSVVASRLSQLFLLEGEPDCAQELFQRAILVNPNGASRARHGMALIALAKNDFEEAERRCREALLLGKFQKKTLSVWRTLIEARLRSGKTGLDAELIAGWRNTKEKTVKARALLEIVRALRSRQDVSWMQLANDWLTSDGASFPIESTELRKLFLATSKTSAIPIAAFQNPSALLASQPNLLVPNEFLAAAKESIRVQLSAGTVPDTQQLINKAQNAFKPSIASKIRHGMAGSLIKGGNYLSAIQLLRTVKGTARRGSSQWGKSVALLAKALTLNNSYSEAATVWQEIYLSPNTEIRFRNQARLEWVKSVVAAGQNADIVATATQISSSISSSDDYETILDTARWLWVADSKTKEIAKNLFQRGERLARAEISNTKHPAKLLQILRKLAWRQSDFGREDHLISDWNLLSTEQKSQLWSRDSGYWEYIGLIYRALTKTGEWRAAESLGDQIMSDPATPTDGLAIIGSKTIVYKARCGEFRQALARCKQIIEAAPKHPATTHAYYWVALDYWKHGDINKAKLSARQILEILGDCPKIEWKRSLVAGAICIISNLNPQISDSTPSISFESLTQELSRIQFRLNILKF